MSYLSRMRTSKTAVSLGSTMEGGRRIEKVWMFAHECAGLAQAGGLGEAVAGLSQTLAVDSKLEISVFLPSHGKHLDQGVKEAYGLEDVSTFIARGHRTGLNGAHYNYLAGLERGVRNNVSYFLAKGLDAQTSRWLDDPVLYDQDIVFEKMALLARTLKSYSEYLLSTGRKTELPDLIHAHDWHMVPASVALKQHLQERGVTVPLVFTVHLLGHVILPWHYASEDWCGIRDLQHWFRIGRNQVVNLNHRHVWEDLCHGSVERFGCYEADYVTSVSDSYLTNDVLDYVGNVIKGKSGHIYNGCDWDYPTIESTFLKQQSDWIGPGPVDENVNRWDLRKYLLTNGLSQARPVTAAGESPRSLRDSRNNDDGVVEAFHTDGPLVLMTGRLSPQKGVDLLLEAVPSILEVIPETRFLLFLLPSNDENQVNSIIATAADYPDNLRLIFGRDRPIYLLSHIAADVYAMPSRSEPFGISALEAMSTGNPVVGSDVGGIRETVLDITRHGDSGTGVLVPPEDAVTLAESIISILLVMQVDEHFLRGKENPGGLIRRIPSKPMMKMVSENPRLGSRIRENCRSRVEENFRWRNAGEMALLRYNAAKKLASEKGRAKRARSRTNN